MHKTILIEEITIENVTEKINEKYRNGEENHSFVHSMATG